MQEAPMQSILIRCFFGLMALLLFNSSIDPPATSLRETSEELALNEQETIVELVLETFLDLDDLFDEHSDGDEDEHSGKLPVMSEYLPTIPEVDCVLYPETDDRSAFLSKTDHLPSGIFRLNTPPPEC